MSEQNSPSGLNPSNPRDWFRLLGWLLFNPAALANHRSKYGKSGERRIGAWWVASAICLPLIFLIFPIYADAEWSSILYRHYQISPLIVLILVGTLWISTGIVGGQANPQLSLISGAIMVAISVMMVAVVMIYLPRNLLMVVSGGLVYAVGISIIGESADHAAAVNLIASMIGLAGGVLLSGFDLIKIAIAAIVIALMLMIAYRGGQVTINSITRRKPSNASYMLTLVLCLAYIVLVSSASALIIS